METVQGHLQKESELENLLKGLQADHLNGLHSPFSGKLKMEGMDTKLESVKKILFELHQKEEIKKSKNWKQKEIILLVYLCDKISLRFQLDFIHFSQQMWADICRLVPSKSLDNCKSKMLNLCPLNLCHSPWKQIENQILAQIIEKQGTSNWNKISLKLFDKNPTRTFRTSKQCRQRYICFLNPNLKKGFWTEKEDYELIKSFLQVGRKWSKMAKYINGRNQNAIKNRFFLLFEESAQGEKQYQSQLMKRVLYHKKRIQKLLGIEQHFEGKLFEEPNVSLDKLQLTKSESNWTSLENKPEEILQIQNYFTF